MFKKLIASHEIRRRVSWLIAAVLILPFIFFFHASGQTPARGPGGAAGTVFGRTIAWDDFQQQQRWTTRKWQRQFGEATPEQLAPVITQAVWDHFIMLAEAKRRRLRVSDAEIRAFLQKIPAFQDEGRFVPERYFGYLRAIGSSPQMFERLLREDLVVERLIEEVKATIVVTDEDVRQAYRRQHEQMRALVFFFGLADFREEAGAGATPEMLRAAYDDNQEAFRVPAQVAFDYAGALRADLAAGVQVTDEEVAAFYEDHPDRFVKDDGSAQPFDDAKDAARAQLIQDRVRKQLNALALDLEDDAEAQRPFDEIVTSRALTTRSAGPLDPKNPWGAGAPEPAIVQAAADVEEGHVSAVVETPQGVFLVRVTKRIPSFIKSFDEARDAVREHVIDRRAKDLARSKAEETHRRLTGAVASGLRFEEAALKEADLPVRSTILMRIGPVDPVGFAPEVNEAAFLTPLGLLSEVMETPDGFAFVRPEERLPVDMAPLAGQEATLRDRTLEEQRTARLSSWLEDLRATARLQDFTGPFAVR